MPEISAVSRPFKEAVDYFRNKVNLPTKTYRDIQHGAHTKAFVVAGATKEDLLADFRSAIDKAISLGTSLQEFRKDFDNIVKQHGWSYKGSRGWRSKTIYATNIQTAYAAGRYKQMTDPDVLKRRPYWQYLVGDSKKHRKEHLKWNGLILPANDPFWETHYPPNGWGCKCRVRSLSENDLKRMGRKPDKAPQDSSDVHPDWRYNIGEAAYGNPFIQHELNENGETKYVWKEVIPEEQEGKKSNYERGTEPLSGKTTKTKQAEKTETLEECRKMIEKTMGGEKRKEYQRTDPTGAIVSVVPESLAKHVLASHHTRDIPFIPETIENPSEIWVTFEKEKNGKYRIRKRYIARFDLKKNEEENKEGKMKERKEKQSGGILVAEGEKGIIKTITSYFAGSITSARHGICIYKK